METKTVESKYINLIDNYYFTADEKQYILVERGNKLKLSFGTKEPTGETTNYTTICGYYSSITSMIEACIKTVNLKSIRNGKISTLTECISQLNENYIKLKDIATGF